MEEGKIKSHHYMLIYITVLTLYRTKKFSENKEFDTPPTTLQKHGRCSDKCRSNSKKKFGGDK
jgi:hypothetical protein